MFYLYWYQVTNTYGVTDFIWRRRWPLLALLRKPLMVYLNVRLVEILQCDCVENCTILSWKVVIFTFRKRSNGKVMFSQACVKNSVQRWGLPQCMLGYIPSLGRHPPGQSPLPGGRPPHQTATVAGGTHPTGMHSCLKIDSILIFVTTIPIYFIETNHAIGIAIVQ